MNVAATSRISVTASPRIAIPNNTREAHRLLHKVGADDLKKACDTDKTPSHRALP
jgi:hypothetical protein